ncbi:MAG TPA: FtsX-like permease family protein [Thermoanaerobaculia bacterium]
MFLIACANVAHLLLARWRDRRRELAVRTALGATRGQLLGQTLVEATLLAGTGAGLGLLLAQWTLDLFIRYLPQALPGLDAVTVDGRIVAGTLALVALTVAAFGLAPALAATRGLEVARVETGRPGRRAPGAQSRRNDRSRPGLSDFRGRRLPRRPARAALRHAREDLALLRSGARAHARPAGRRVGVYGVMAYNVSRRKHEMGVRAAFGARAGDLARQVLGEGMTLVAIGLVAGMLLAAAASGLLEGLLFGVSAMDPRAFAAAAGVLVVAALLACWLPARRAGRVDVARMLHVD